MPNISKRISLFSESAIARISHMAETYEAINLSEGFPDFPPPEAPAEPPEGYSLSGAAPIQYRQRRTEPAAGLGELPPDLRRPDAGPGTGSRRHLRRHGSPDDDDDGPRRPGR